jgi:hypothetical protein
MGTLGNKIFLLVSELLLGSIPQLVAANKKVSKNLKKRKKLGPSDQDPGASLPLEKVRKHHEHELSRRKNLEDKAKTNITAVTIAVTVLFSGLTLLGNDKIITASGTTRTTLICVLVFCVVNFILGGLFAMWALQVGELWLPGLSHELLDEREQAAHLLYAIELNQLETIIRYNWLSASYYCIRNAVFTLSVLVLIIAAHLLKYTLYTPYPQQQLLLKTLCL